MQKKRAGKNSLVKKTVRVVSTVLLIVSTLLCFVVVINSTVTKDADFFGYRLFYVISGSMEPTLPVGSLLVVKQCDAYAEDDIITFYSEDESIKGHPNTHRIIDIEEKDGQIYYVTKGDANNIPDDPVSHQDVIGKVYHCIDTTILKDLVQMLGTPMGFFLVILLPLLGVAVICMRDFKRTMQEEIRRAAQESIEKEMALKEECYKDETEGNDTTE